MGNKNLVERIVKLKTKIKRAQREFEEQIAKINCSICKNQKTWDNSWVLWTIMEQLMTIRTLSRM